MSVGLMGPTSPPVRLDLADELRVQVPAVRSKQTVFLKDLLLSSEIQKYPELLEQQSPSKACDTRCPQEMRILGQEWLEKTGRVPQTTANLSKHLVSLRVVELAHVGWLLKPKSG